MNKTLLSAFILFVQIDLSPDKTNLKKSEPLFNEETFSGIKLSNIGPALMSVRISDIAFHSTNRLVS